MPCIWGLSMIIWPKNLGSKMFNVWSTFSVWVHVPRRFIRFHHSLQLFGSGVPILIWSHQYLEWIDTNKQGIWLATLHSQGFLYPIQLISLLYVTWMAFGWLAWRFLVPFSVVMWKDSDFFLRSTLRKSDVARLIMWCLYSGQCLFLIFFDTFHYECSRLVVGYCSNLSEGQRRFGFPHMCPSDIHG